MYSAIDDRVKENIQEARIQLANRDKLLNEELENQLLFTDPKHTG